MAYATLAYISNTVLKLKSGNIALIAAVFLVIAGLLSSIRLTSENRIIQESKSFSPPALVQTAQAQNSLPAIAAVYGGALTGPVPSVNNGNEDGVSPLTYSGGAIEEPGSPVGPVAVSANATVKSNAAQLANRSGALPNSNGRFVMPTNGHNLGILHNYAVDIVAACGTPVVAAADGLVVPDKNNPNVLEGWNGGYGSFIFLEHSFDDGVFTRYAHLQKSLVSVGDSVKQGQEIGLVGKTGDAAGCKLSFEVIGAQNPFAKK